MSKYDDNIETMKKYIQEHEGLRLTKYKDTVGKATIGWGHLILSHENYDTITLEKANEIFEDDFRKHYEQAEQFPGFDKLPFSHKCVVTDLCFNMGGNFYLNFPKFTKYLSEGNSIKAAYELKNSKYAKQVGRRATNNIALLIGKKSL